MPRILIARGTPPGLGEPISPSEGPPNRHPIGARADGVPREPGSLDFRIGGIEDAAHGGRRKRGGIGGGEYPPSFRTVGGAKAPRSRRMGGTGGGGELKFGSPRPNFKQLIGGNADELRPSAENSGKGLGEKVSPSQLPPIPRPIGLRGRWRGGGTGFPNRETAPRGRITPPNETPKEQTFGGDLPPKVCTFGHAPSPSIGALAEWGGEMAPVFQSAADRSDRH